MIKDFFTKKMPGSEGFTINSTKYLREKYDQSYTGSFRGEVAPLTTFCEFSINPVSTLENNERRTKNDRPISVLNRDIEVFHKH